MKKQFIVLITLFLSAFLTGCADRYETSVVEGVVIEKEYEKSKTTYRTKKVNGKTKKTPIYHPEEFDVTIQYKKGEKVIEREFEFSTDDFYNEVEVGTKMNVNLVRGFSKKNKLVSETIELIDEK